MFCWCRNRCCCHYNLLEIELRLARTCICFIDPTHPQFHTCIQCMRIYTHFPSSFGDPCKYMCGHRIHPLHSPANLCIAVCVRVLSHVTAQYDMPEFNGIMRLVICLCHECKQQYSSNARPNKQSASTHAHNLNMTNHFGVHGPLRSDNSRVSLELATTIKICRFGDPVRALLPTNCSSRNREFGC